MTTTYKYTRTEKVVNATLKTMFNLLCRVDTEQLNRIPKEGPLIIVTNHVNFIEGPIVYTHLQPRPLTGYAKIETWDNRFMGWLFDVWQAIPIRRGEADLTAIKRGVAALNDGQFLAIAPEGTRSNNGCLQCGHPGAVILALRSGAPLIPLVSYGHETYRHDLKNFRRPSFTSVVGRPFRLEPGGERVTSAVRQQMTDEIMYQMAVLLPPEYRGEYADLSKATTKYLMFESET
jgi:1-acyl-sn-glycerol-3-phosphate acyltransferase